MSAPIDRRSFVQSTLCCAAACAAAMSAAPVPLAAAPAEGDGSPLPDKDKAATVHDWLTQFIHEQETGLDRDALEKLLHERGRQCCARLDFRRQMAAEAGGDVDRLVALLGERVGPENCRREGDTVTLIYPVDHCVCGWSRKVEKPTPDDPYCACSQANNQRLFEVVSGRTVSVQVTDSPRRNGKPCRFVITLS